MRGTEASTLGQRVGQWSTADVWARMRPLDRRCFIAHRKVPVTAAILDGKKLAKQIREELRDEVADFIENNAEVPTLAAVLVGNDPASEVYVRNKVTACEQVGMQSRLFRLPADTSQDELLALVAKLNKAKDEPVHGILVQLPLPKQIDVTRVLHAVSPLKDVDGFHPENVGRMVQGTSAFSALHAVWHSAVAGPQRHRDRRPARGGRGAQRNRRQADGADADAARRRAPMPR